MKYYITRKKNKTDECDCGGAAIDVGMSMGMGPVVVDGGPDRFDNVVFPVQTQAFPKTGRKRYKAKKRRR